MLGEMDQQPRPLGTSLLPRDSWSMRVVWSVPALLIIAVWSVGLLGANATSFPVQYTFVEVLQEIARAWPGVLQPSEFDFILHVGPALALVLWPLCLFAARTHRQAIGLQIAAMLIPTVGYLLSHPLLLLLAPLCMPVSLVKSPGEHWQDGFVAFGGAALWWWFMLVQVLMAFFLGDVEVRRIRRGLCPACGYQVGTSSVCTECGKPVMPKATGGTA